MRRVRPTRARRGGWARGATLLLAAGLIYACSGEGVIGELASRGEAPKPTPPAAPGEAPATLARGATGVARLSREEYAATVKAVLGVDLGSDVELLPADSFTPFDNDYTLQVPSRTLVEGLKAVAERAVAKALADPATRAAWVGCMPARVDDAGCLGDFIRRFGRRALRRPLSDAEVQGYLAFLEFARSSNDFFTAVSMVGRAMLQDLEFVYRVEIGQPVANRPGVFVLGDFELASRLSYFLWGRNPDDELLDQAAAGGLRTAEGLRAAAERLLADERGMRRIERFHALWWGYARLPHSPELNTAMRRETDALVRRVVFEEGRPWLDLFTSNETYLDATLSQAYGLPAPEEPGFQWVTYPEGVRRGILSHGALLSNGVRGEDTSPTLRGKFIQERMLCTPIPPPPDGVVADQPPPATDGNNCKYDRYAAHRTAASCSGCHQLMDGIGFGLENYDPVGAFRSHDVGRPECTIEGTGNLPGVGSFRGPVELADRLIESGKLPGCVVQRLYQLGLGRAPRGEDTPMLDALSERFEASGYRLRALVLDWVSSDSFRERIVDTL